MSNCDKRGVRGCFPLFLNSFSLKFASSILLITFIKQTQRDMNKELNITVKNKKSTLEVVTLLSTGGKKVESFTVLNEVLTSCLMNYTQEVSFFSLNVPVKGSKAADTFYNVISQLESVYDVETEFVNGKCLIQNLD